MKAFQDSIFITLLLIVFMGIARANMSVSVTLAHGCPDTSNMELPFEIKMIAANQTAINCTIKFKVPNGDHCPNQFLFESVNEGIHEHDRLDDSYNIGVNTTNSTNLFFVSGRQFNSVNLTFNGTQVTLFSTQLPADAIGELLGYFRLRTTFCENRSSKVIAVVTITVSTVFGSAVFIVIIVGCCVLIRWILQKDYDSLSHVSGFYKRKEKRRNSQEEVAAANAPEPEAEVLQMQDEPEIVDGVLRHRPTEQMLKEKGNPNRWVGVGPAELMEDDGLYVWKVDHVARPEAKNDWKFALNDGRDRRVCDTPALLMPANLGGWKIVLSLWINDNMLDLRAWLPRSRSDPYTNRLLRKAGGDHYLRSLKMKVGVMFKHPDTGKPFIKKSSMFTTVRAAYQDSVTIASVPLRRFTNDTPPIIEVRMTPAAETFWERMQRRFLRLLLL